MKRLILIGVLLLAGCFGRKPTAPAPQKSYTADVLLIVKSTAPKGLWLRFVSTGDTSNQILVTHDDSLRCVWFTTDSAVSAFVLLYGNLDMTGYDKIIWASSPQRNHLDIVADADRIHTYVTRTTPCGKEEN